MRSPRCAFWLLPVLLILLIPTASTAQVSITVNFAPPELPVYEQPPCPEQGWMWTPGYWAYDDDGYYWVPGEWVPAPYEGALWTPPWWGWDDGRYIFHPGYWGDQVGYYGGIDYGFGYMGVGFAGGEWRDGRFAYNTAVMRVDRDRVRDTYEDREIVRNYTVPDERRVAFNGGPNGIRHDPTPRERAAMSVRHAPPTPVQTQHIQAAQSDRSLYAKANGGHPRTLAVQRPGELGRNPGNAERPNNGSRAVPESRTPPSPRPESRMPAGRSETRTPSTEPRSMPRPESRPVPNERPRPESRPAPPPRTETRPESRPQPRPESRPESRPAPPRTETRPAPEARPAPQHESRPAPPPEARPAPQRETRPAPQHEMRSPAPQREARPIPPARQESRPAPEARPAPQHESRPAPPARPEKPKSDEKPHE